MSGPKVVRIVTRDEIIAVCRGHLARVDAALAEWTRIGRRDDCVDDEAVAAAGARRDALAALIEADRFMDLQKQAATEEAFLRDDLKRRLAVVAARQAEARSRARRERQAGAGVMRRMEELGLQIDSATRAGLERGDADALSAGFAALADATTRPTAAPGLVAGLRDDASAATFQELLAAQPSPPGDPAIERIAARLDELSTISERGTAEAWQARLDEAERSEPARRGLLLDGLEVETGRALTEARRRATLGTELLLLTAELRELDPAADLGDDADGDAARLQTTIDAVRAKIETVRTERAAAARRAAVLEGLAGLGYEVTEGMSTSLAADGRLVLRSAARPDYGVEVSAASERMQMRPVAFESGGLGPDPGRDRDAETIWCGDVTTLQGALTRAGGGLVIEKSLPVGATPLKRITINSSPPPGTAAEVQGLRSRTLR